MPKINFELSEMIAPPSCMVVVQFDIEIRSMLFVLLQSMQGKKIYLGMLLCILAFALDNGQALTPPLLLTTDAQGCDINEVIVRKYAKYLNQTGMMQSGYTLVLLKDCWQVRSQKGQLQPDPSKFTISMKVLADQLHQMGLKLGLGTDIGLRTRLGRPGSMGYQAQDIAQFADWGIDYVWIDNYQQVTGSRARFSTMSQLIQATGRPITIALNNQGRQGVAGWAGAVANTWQIVSQVPRSYKDLISTIALQEGHEVYSGTGAWNDMGALLMTSELTLPQFMTQLVMWVALKSPLALPCIQVPSDRMSILQNDQLLSLHQDSLGKQGRLVRRDIYSTGTQDVWLTPLTGNRYLLVFINAVNREAGLELNLRTEGKLGPVKAYAIRDPVERRWLGSSSNEVLSLRVAAEGVGARVVSL